MIFQLKLGPVNNSSKAYSANTRRSPAFMVIWQNRLNMWKLIDVIRYQSSVDPVKRPNTYLKNSNEIAVV